MEQEIVHFLRKRDYILERELGQGACGKTVLLRDDQLDAFFVCKKYSPYSDQHRQELYSNFIREIKLLHEIHHPNVVRVFNYYLYPELLTGYILMEYVEGTDIERYVRANPEQTNEVFLQTIEGFRYLESNRILHRDIRPLNFLVGEDGTVKIIDLGFGKRIQQSADFDKSITLNWWCETPAEFASSIYDFTTEVYFVGKLFEKLIQDYGIEHFQYRATLAKMCDRNPESRIKSFFEVQKEIQSNRFFEIEFSPDELSCYRAFADAANSALTKIEFGAKYVDDLERVKTQLDAAYRKSMLEEFMPDCAPVLRCFLSGAYYYRKAGFSVTALKDFVRFLKAATVEKQRIAFANLHTRLDAITRYSDETSDDIPF
ncbi:MAG: protein kinase family protein [Porticoccaceae bacterium]